MRYTGNIISEKKSKKGQRKREKKREGERGRRIKAEEQLLSRLSSYHRCT
jgi:hypothetical protein